MVLNMTDFTNYDNIQLEGLLLSLIDETTEPLTEEKDDGETKTVVSPVFKTGIGFDTESTTIYSDPDTMKDVEHCFCYSYQVSVGREHYAIYRTIEQFLNFFEVLQSVVRYKNMDVESPAKLYIWVANLAHEWSFIKYAISDRFECTKIFAKTARDCLLIEFGNIQFRECIGLFGHSLADIAKNWTTTQKAKGDLDYNLIRTAYTPLTDTEKGYCINDVLILSEMHEAITKAYQHENGTLTIPFTSSGFVRMKLKDAIRNDVDITEERTAREHCFKKPPKNNIEYLMKQNRYIFVSPEQWTLCREYGYSGGLCGSNIEYIGKDLKNITCADLTSDYPAQMLHCKFPNGWLKEYHRRYYTKIVQQKRPYFIMAVVDFESKTNHATFSEHKIINAKREDFEQRFGAVKELIVYNGKVLRCKNAVVILNDVDISAYEMIYKLKIKVLKVWAFDRYGKIPKWLSESLTDDYIKKAVLKHEGKNETIEYKDAKRNANTYYGVLATRAQDSFDTFYNGLFVPSETKPIKQMFRECWLNPYIAFWVTSYARRILMYFISKYPDKIVQYDTDSLYFKPCDALNAELNEYNKKQIAMNEKIFAGNKNIELLLDLGCWDFEKSCQRFLAMGAKKYIKMQGDQIKTVIAGLPKQAIPKEIEAKHITKPLTYYNVMKHWLKTNCENNKIIIEHLFAHKFASVYNDDPNTYKVMITDYQGNTVEQICGCYHAITPIDFTLSIAVDYLKHALHVDKENPL